MFSPLTFYKCLADDTRLRTLLLVVMKGELCVCDLQSALKLSQPKVSRHLAELRKCNLLHGTRRGKWVYYQVHPELPEWATEVLKTTAQHNEGFIKPNLKLSCC